MIPKHFDDLNKMSRHHGQAMLVEMLKRGLKIAENCLVHRSPPINVA